MAREFERRVVELVANSLGAEKTAIPEWLVRPGRTERGPMWTTVQCIYRALTGLELPEQMRSIERRIVDATFVTSDGIRRILEVDEKQHFNNFRALTLKLYPDDLELGFDLDDWVTRSENKNILEGGGFASPKPPLFPGINGRHRQRAFRDALCDILPAQYGFASTLRVSEYEARSWVWQDNAAELMKQLLDRKVGCG